VAAFLLLLVVPLYALTAIVVVRSGILKFDKGGFTQEQFKSMWTFIASGLATCATVLAALLAKSHNERSSPSRPRRRDARRPWSATASRRAGIARTRDTEQRLGRELGLDQQRHAAR
jgi:hypothetical protein